MSFLFKRENTSVTLVEPDCEVVNILTQLQNECRN